VEINKNGVWTPITFQDLHNGDTFRLFEPTGEPVTGDNNDTEFIATSEPYIINNIVTIDIKE
jgi:hypothetical protein